MKQVLSIKYVASCSMLAAALILSPLALDQIPNVDSHSQVLAKGGNGGGNGGGRGGGRGGGNSKSKSNSGGHVGSNGNADGDGHNGHGNGHAKHGDKHAKIGQDDDDSELRGSLNAAHASANARLHAAPHSRVGLIATYEKAVLASGVSDDEATDISDLLDQLEDPNLTNPERHAIQAELAAIVDGLESGEATDAEDIDTLADAALSTLESASNKELDADDKMIDAVNELLGIEEPNAVVDQVKELNE